MNKEIKRMTTIIGNVKPFYVEAIAEALYNAGYRKIENANGHNLPHEIDYLLTEFDEMGFAPTSLCDNPEGKAKLWKSAFVYEIGLLLDEYAAIKEKAVKEFADKVKEEVYPFLQAEMYNKKHFITGDHLSDKLLENQNIGILKAQDVLSKWFKVKIDELLKEYE